MRSWIIRAIVYPAVLGLLAFLLVGNPVGAAKEAPYWTMRGTTEQGEDIKLRLDAHARVRTFDVRVDLYCEGGGISFTRWNPSESGAPARFGSRGPRLDAVENRSYAQPDGSTLIVGGVLRGRVSRSRATGTVEMTRTIGGHEQCSSGPMRWTTD
jgi:hypothetical protein